MQWRNAARECHVAMTSEGGGDLRGTTAIERIILLHSMFPPPSHISPYSHLISVLHSVVEHPSTGPRHIIDETI